MLLTKAENGVSNPGPTNTRTIWMCDLCAKQIYIRKQVSVYECYRGRIVVMDVIGRRLCVSMI